MGKEMEGEGKAAAEVQQSKDLIGWCGGLEMRNRHAHLPAAFHEALKPSRRGCPT